MTHCPKCPSETLVNSNYLGDIPLDHCPACGGIWFDKGELEALLSQSQGLASSDFNLITPKPVGGACPRCNKQMPRGGLVNPLLLVDKCQDCGGIWLDGRELELLKKLLNLTGGPSAVKLVARPPVVPSIPAPAPLFRLMPLLSVVLGSIGLVYQVRAYLAATEPPSLMEFFVVTFICIALFSYGLFTLFQKASPRP